MHLHLLTRLFVQVQISGVPDSSNVSYRLAVGQTIDGVRSFLTPPKVGPDSRTTIAVVGDWGQTDNSVKTGQHMLDANASITLIAGDLSYADGFQPYWDSWGRMTEALLSSRPFMAAPGSIPPHRAGSPPSPSPPTRFARSLRRILTRPP